MGLAPMIPGIDDLNSFFTDHASFVSLGIRGEVALPTLSLSPPPPLSFTTALESIEHTWHRSWW